MAQMTLENSFVFSNTNLTNLTNLFTIVRKDNAAHNLMKIPAGEDKDSWCKSSMKWAKN